MSTTQLPAHHNLFIATPNTIHLYSRSNRRKLFECETPNGILNARAARDNSALVAVADNHLVMLYDATKGNDRQHKLKSGEGDPRLLLFSPDSRTLYYSTTLCYQIQAYSIPTAELLPPFEEHPSPPNVLAISKDGEVLLSASPSPPTVYLHDIRLHSGVQTRLLSDHIESLPVCAAFSELHETAETPFCVFVIGYQNGTLTLYRLPLPILPPQITANTPRQPHKLAFPRPVKIGAIKKLHKPTLGGIRAAEFIPGYKARVVSIGHDGKCRIVDFEADGEVLRTWRIEGLPTCLTVISTDPIQITGRRKEDITSSGDGAEESVQAYQGSEAFIAIATPVKVLVFNILGLLIQEIQIKSPVVALEWVNDMSAPSVLPNRLTSSPVCVNNSSLPSNQPLLEMWTVEYENVSDEISGTVKMTKSPLLRSMVASPLIKLSPDLFSSPPERRQSNISIISCGSPTPRQTTTRPRKSYSRPRILTETFTAPDEPTRASTISINPRRPERPVHTTTIDAHRWSQTQDAPDLPLTSDAFGLRDDSPNNSVQSDTEEQEIWTTPLSSTLVPNGVGATNSQRTVAFEMRSNRQVHFHRSSPPTSVVAPPISATKVETADSMNSISSTVDADAGSRRPTWMHKPSHTPHLRRRSKTRDAHDDVTDDETDHGDDAQRAAKKKRRERYSLKEDHGQIRSELEALKQEVLLLRAAVFHSRT